MKAFFTPIASLCLATTALLSVARAEVSPVRIRVEATNKPTSEKDKSSQTRILNVILDNSSAEQLELKVKFMVFGRDVASKDVVTLNKGEVPATVKAKGSEKVQTPATTATVTEPKPAKGKKVDPSGQKIIGHAIQVLKGDTLVAELYEPASMKANIETAGAKPAEAKK